MSKAEASTPNGRYAPVFAALGDPTRLDLLSRLGAGRPLSITALSAGRPLSRQAVTRHLKVLEDVGLVVSDRIGRETRFNLHRQRLAETRAYLHGVEAQWDAAIVRLRALVEEPPS